MARIVVSDSTSLIALAQIKRLALLNKLYGKVIVPRAVHAEITRTPAITVQVQNATWLSVEDVQHPAVVHRLQEKLDLGEAEAIALALEKSATVLIVDEKAARAVAKGLGQNIIGLLGVLVLAKKADHIDALEPALDELAAKNFHFTPALRTWALEQAGEGDQSAEDQSAEK